MNNNETNPSIEDEPNQKQTKAHRDPSSFAFNDDELEQIKEHMDKNSSRLMDIDENLATDKVRVPNQNYALISIVSPQNPHQRCDKCCVKIRGVFETLESANSHANKIAKVDPSFDVMVVSLYEWLMIPPDMDRIEDQQYTDDQLNGLISECRKNQERTKIEFDVRKEALKQNTHTSL